MTHHPQHKPCLSIKPTNYPYNHETHRTKGIDNTGKNKLKNIAKEMRKANILESDVARMLLNSQVAMELHSMQTCQFNILEGYHRKDKKYNRRKIIALYFNQNYCLI